MCVQDAAVIQRSSQPGFINAYGPNPVVIHVRTPFPSLPPHALCCALFLPPAGSLLAPCWLLMGSSDDSDITNVSLEPVASFLLFPSYKFFPFPHPQHVSLFQAFSFPFLSSLSSFPCTCTAYCNMCKAHCSVCLAEKCIAHSALWSELCPVSNPQQAANTT